MLSRFVSPLCRTLATSARSRLPTSRIVNPSRRQLSTETKPTPSQAASDANKSPNVSTDGIKTTTQSSNAVSDQIAASISKTPPKISGSEASMSQKIGPEKVKDESVLATIFVGLADSFLYACLGYLGVKAYQYLTDFPPICQEMLNKAEQSPFIIEHVGVPFKRDIFWWGSVNDNSARVSIGITGPLGSGTIEGKAYRMDDNTWEILVLHGALEKFGNRLTDLLPTSNFANVMPYIPHPNDPSAAHSLAGAPALPYTPNTGIAGIAAASAATRDQPGTLPLLDPNDNPKTGETEVSREAVHTSATPAVADQPRDANDSGSLAPTPATVDV